MHGFPTLRSLRCTLHVLEIVAETLHGGLHGRLHSEYSLMRSSTLEDARVRSSTLEYARVLPSTTKHIMYSSYQRT